uniref:Uncharacterized protein n=1 Tax=Cyprinodon variegatus TaxID=28743 RepID=A0A3Q2CDR0_CYPVA
MRYLLEWTDEEEDEGELRSESRLCHPLCQCPNCAPTQKVCSLWSRKVLSSWEQMLLLGVSSCNADGFTPLHVAALHGHSSIAALLIRHGANVNARTNQNATPLHLASQNSHVQVEEQLLSLAMKQLIGIILINQLLKLSPSKSRLIINWSVEALRRVVRFLLECNAKLNKKDHYGNTPLIHACLRGNLETASTLLQVDARTDTQQLLYKVIFYFY